MPPAYSASNDLGLWSPIYTTFPIKNKFLGYLEINPRLGNNITDFSQLLTRPAVGYKITDNFSIWQGYAWVTNHIGGFRNENRIFQQFLLNNYFKYADLIHRVRIEERFIEDTGSTQIRLRYMLRSIFPFGKLKKWAWVIYDELFVNATSVANGPESGIDQNRLFVGINRKFNERINADLGYQLQYINEKSPVEDKFNHVILINIFANL